MLLSVVLVLVLVASGGAAPLDKLKDGIDGVPVVPVDGKSVIPLTTSNFFQVTASGDWFVKL
jgi:hypothetical protein